MDLKVKIISIKKSIKKSLLPAKDFKNPKSNPLLSFVGITSQDRRSSLMVTAAALLVSGGGAAGGGGGSSWSRK